MCPLLRPCNVRLIVNKRLTPKLVRLKVRRYNPPKGLLLKFADALAYLVLIRGRHLDKPLNEGAIDLTTIGLQRRRVL